MAGPQHRLPRAATGPALPLRPLRTRTTAPVLLLAAAGPPSLRMDGLRAGALAGTGGCASACVQQERTPGADGGDDVAAQRAARIYSRGPQLVMPYLYLGSERNVAAAQLVGRGVTHVVNVAQEVADQASGNVDIGGGHTVRYRHYRWGHSEADMARDFAECFAFIDAARRRHEGVLVHCQLGVSRSASLVIAYAMRTMDLGFAAAYDYVRLRAPCISPNLQLIAQLCEYGRALDAARRAAPLRVSTAAAPPLLPPVPELASCASASENSSPTDSDSAPYCGCPPTTLPLLTPKPSASEQDPLQLHRVAQRHPLVP
ncbi:hypothetical protein H4R19_001032 [Coemansia spiralis]|nr:hypothetical protein H4R19_001032 [Coemansia spiralis]